MRVNPLFAGAVIALALAGVVATQDFGKDPLPPVAPKSINECYAFNRAWGERIAEMIKQHEACSTQVYKSCGTGTLQQQNDCFKAEKNPAWDADGVNNSLYRRCQSLKQAYKRAEIAKKQQVSNCNNEVDAAMKARSSSKQDTGSTRGGTGTGGNSGGSGKSGPVIMPTIPGGLFGGAISGAGGSSGGSGREA